jgi:hypothetical protein
MRCRGVGVAQSITLKLLKLYMVILCKNNGATPNINSPVLDSGRCPLSAVRGRCAVELAPFPRQCCYGAFGKYSDHLTFFHILWYFSRSSKKVHLPVVQDHIDAPLWVAMSFCVSLFSVANLVGDEPDFGQDLSLFCI